MPAPDTSTLVAAIERVRAELGDEYPHQAALAAALAVDAGHDLDAAAKRYCTGDWWGGSGSVFDVAPEDPVRNRRLMHALLDLVRAFEALGVNCSSAASRAETIATWLNRDAR